MPVRTRSTVPLLAATLLIATAASAATPLPGFTETVLVPGGAGGVTAPVAVAYEPGTGDLWVLEKGGGATARIRVRDAVTGVVSTIHTLSNIDNGSERGLLGIAFDPDYLDPIQPATFVYLYYTTTLGAPHNRVSRFTVSGGALTAEQVLLEGPTLTAATNHNGGTLRFGPDELLYISMGDNDTDTRVQPQYSQDLRDLRGKILRIARDGSIPPDNPHAGSLSVRNEIWAHGLRNPFRFSVDPATGTLYIADVGQSTWEYVYRGILGANHGYPCWDGPTEYPPGIPSAFCTAPPDPAGVTFPVYWYGHGAQTPPVQGTSITGGPVYRASAFPPNHQGRYFFGDFGAGWIRSASIELDGRLTGVEMFVTGVRGVVDIIESPSGCLTYVSYNGDGVRDVCFVGGGNSQPVAVATGIPLAGLSPLDVQFTGSASSDPDGDTLTYARQFGDGGNSTAADPLYQYAANGVYQATLTVDDGRGQPNSSHVAPSLRVVVGNEAPTPSITMPTAGSTYVAGRTVDFAGTGTDPEDGAIPDSGFEWTVVFHHGTHEHPFLGPIRGQSSGTFTIPNAGEDAQDVFYRIHLMVTDSGAPLGAAGRLSASTYVDIVPVISNVTLAVDLAIPGIELELNGLAQPAPVSFSTVAGFGWTIGMPSPQVLGLRTVTFGAWSDGGARQHDVFPDLPIQVYTARILCNVIEEVQDLRVRKGLASNVIVASWRPVTDICLNDIDDAEKYRVWASSTAWPTLLPGSFPSDPRFTVATWSDWEQSDEFDPGPGLQYLLVTAVGRDLGDGPVGHYPTP